jgi:hypothetical protein
MIRKGHVCVAIGWRYLSSPGAGAARHRPSGIGQPHYCLVPHRLSGIWRNRLASPPQIIAVDRVVLQKDGFDHERGIGRRILTLYAVITH